jgi:hypothetical protein
MAQLNDQSSESSGQQQESGKAPGFSGFLTSRVVAGIVLGLFALWGAWALLGFFEGGKGDDLDESDIAELSHVGEAGHGEPSDLGDEAQEPGHDLPGVHDKPGELGAGSSQDTLAEHQALPEVGGPEHGAPAHQSPAPVRGAAAGKEALPSHGLASEGVASPEQALLHGPASTPHEPKAVGVHLVEATVSVLEKELNQRFWGWRRNDLIRFTDNVENIQLGILEVVRRTSVSLMEKMSRHGVSASIDPNLENAMNWFMIKPDKYWLPSAEEKYRASLKELRRYAEKLEMGKARFYVRTDTLIPLLLAFADVAGSCDENLVKAEEDDGSPVSWFKVDDYFYYSKGVAIAMGTILHAVREDFSGLLEARQGVDLLNRAIHACHVAGELDPWLVTDAALDGILANHRANMAAEISHLRYFLNALAKALAT